ncbi:hypothetical protein CK203_060029 [Vitis vinifera]|uniref:Reverse transcriptase/retrotransposon-derived protein RNase H-like domain-containing protein n=1 Tax=Vitis vinifera TaxID=29760 RepID=A0A438GMW1_VITVI|nr:hypothetical protein CK203_060029 [Vitis vinifera]
MAFGRQLLQVYAKFAQHLEIRTTPSNFAPAHACQTSSENVFPEDERLNLWFLGVKEGYFQIAIALEDQEKTTFTCPFSTYAYKRMPFGLCNASATFQREGIQVDPAKIELISKLSLPTTVKEDAEFIWTKACQEAFERLKSLLTTAPIMRPPNWSFPFELMCDASDYIVRVVLGQRENGKPYVVYYASKTLNDA